MDKSVFEDEVKQKEYTEDEKIVLTAIWKKVSKDFFYKILSGFKSYDGFKHIIDNLLKRGVIQETVDFFYINGGFDESITNGCIKEACEIKEGLVLNDGS